MFSNIGEHKISVCVMIFIVSTLLVNGQSCKKEVTRPVRYWTRCMECSVNGLLRCPRGFHHSTSGEGLQNCGIYMRFGYLNRLYVRGCRHICTRDEKFSECCPDHWGSDCQVCPGTPVCSRNGNCSDGLKGNGSCICQEGFKGTACELCTDKNKFGPSCNSSCTCKNGECDSWVNGTGQCKPYTCKNGYYGQDCEKSHPPCINGTECHTNASCFTVDGNDTCVCNTGFNGTGQNCSAINPCTEGKHGCHKYSECQYMGPGRHQCICAEGYKGDGYVCTVIDNCQAGDNGGCPKNSTKCNFLGPGKSNCSCLAGYQNYTKDGCALIDLCNDGSRGGCDVNADCIMRAPLLKSCECRSGYRGNGTVCYGNIIQRVNQLNSDGEYKGRLTRSNLIFSHALARPLTGAGPFTVFVVTDAGVGKLSSSQSSQFFSNPDFASHIVRLHLVAGDLDSFALRAGKSVTTLQGSKATISVENGTLYYHVVGQSYKARIETPDLLAGNGIIHIIDSAMWLPGNYRSTQTMDVVQVLETESRFKMFAGLLLNSGILSDINALSQKTVLAPEDSAFTRLPNETLKYLLGTEQGRTKLQILIKNHFVNSKIDISDLIYQTRITSIGGDSSVVKIQRFGEIKIAEKATVTETNILGSNGVIHVIDNLLIPPEMDPLLPNFCNKSTNLTTTGFCYRCDAIGGFPRRGCRPGYIPDGNKTSSCTYYIRYRGIHTFPFRGCRTSTCYQTRPVPECCAGFYGALCLFCPGPLSNPCYGNGKCQDGIRGNGTCSCTERFRGTACELCKDSNKFGQFCNQTCTCIHGVCDSGPRGNGTCRPDTCLTGYHGNNCDQRDTVCPSSSALRCHTHAHCLLEGNAETCKCNAGYEGSGLQCTEINRCSQPDRGGCHRDASCIKTGPGTNNCSCSFGFEGDGIYCKVIDPCAAGNQGGCHVNAQCLFVGPGQSICKCKEGYTGTGIKCSEINRCLVNNGGCPSQSQCSRTGPGTTKCSCLPGYVTTSTNNGTVVACLPSIATLIVEEPYLSLLSANIKMGNLIYQFADAKKNLTVFAPSNAAISTFPNDEKNFWTASTERMKFLINYHTLDSRYTLSQLKTMISANAVNGETLNFSVQANDTLFLINGAVHVTKANVAAANGFLHVVDKVLLPPRPVVENIYNLSTLLRNDSRFSEFVRLLKDHSLITALDTCAHCTVFAPTNKALKKYNKTIKRDQLLYHFMKHYVIVETIINDQEFSTVLGNTYKVKLTKSPDGKIQANRVDIVSNRPMKSFSSVAYAINGILVPTKSICPEAKKVTEYSSCLLFYCFVKAGCRSGSAYLARSRCGNLFFPECRWKCSRTEYTSKCCEGFWGQTCQSCPETAGIACSGYGTCSDGKTGNGHCSCTSPHVTGTACEICNKGFYGKGCAHKCLCSVNSTCNDGMEGDGSCACFHNWKGTYCNISTDHSNCRIRCHQHATCRGPPNNGSCECDAGWAGNGTVCTEEKSCSDNNGGCHTHANCTPDSTRFHGRRCSCLRHYTGDGVYCQAIDPCQTNNGGCHKNAFCSMVGPGKRNCFCKQGFSGDGLKSCLGIDPCKHDNGGCSIRAVCEPTGPHQRICRCKAPYVGNGFTCLGDFMDALKNDPQLSKFVNIVRKYKLNKYLESSTTSGLLAPSNKAIEKAFSSRKRRSLTPRPSTEQILKYHIVSCIRLSSITYATDVNLTSLLGPPLRLKRVNGEVTINGVELNGTLLTNNGVVLKLNKVLIPPVSASPSDDQLMDLYNTSKARGYKIVAEILKMGGVLALLNSPTVAPTVMFWPTDEAINSLPTDIKLKFINPSTRAEAEKYISYHIIINMNGFGTENLIRGGAGVEFRTMEGSSLFVSCGGGKGDLYVNGRSKIVEREIRFKSGVAYGIDKMLIPLGMGGRCDEVRDEKNLGQCGSCFLTTPCQDETTFLGMANHNCTYGNSSNLIGCQPVCLQRVRHNKCCSNLYGPNCQPCPGGVSNPCSGHGTCSEGLNGSGTCTCSANYSGAACEVCLANSKCPASKNCSTDNGGCHPLATCNDTISVTCTCPNGYRGDGRWCEMIDKCLQNNGGCGQNATCLFAGPGRGKCLCRPGFTIEGSLCVAHPIGSPCASNNGGCSAYAVCTNTGDFTECSCRQGFTGDGRTCEGSLIQVIQETANLTEFYKAMYRLKSIGHSSLLTALQDPINKFTLFVPVNSAVNSKKLSNFNNLANHIVRGRIFLLGIKTGESKSVATLIGSKLLIKRTRTNFVINNIAHTIGDIPATNGVIHVVDQIIPISGVPTPTTTSPTSATETTKPTQTTKAGTEFTTVNASVTTTTTAKISVVAKSKGLSAAKTAGIVISCVIVVAVVVAILIYCVYKKKVLPHPSFRYKKCGEQNSYELAVKQDEDTVQYDSDAFTEPSNLFSFENLMYDQHHPADTVEMKTPERSGKGSDFHDISNPVYDEVNAHVVEPQTVDVASAHDPGSVRTRDFKVPFEQPGEENC